MKILALFSVLLIVTVAVAQDEYSLLRLQIKILIGTASTVPDGTITQFDAGPVIGNMLNAHYFPGLREYGDGRYDYAEDNMTFVINRAVALIENPRQSEFMSTAHYIRGMIYLYHAIGVGRHRLARADFEAAIQWNPKNFIAYLELSRVYSVLGLKDPAVSIIRRLLSLNPDKTTAEQARKELMKLGVEAKP